MTVLHRIRKSHYGFTAVLAAQMSTRHHTAHSHTHESERTEKASLSLSLAHSHTHHAALASRCLGPTHCSRPSPLREHFRMHASMVVSLVWFAFFLSRPAVRLLPLRTRVSRTQTRCPRMCLSEFHRWGASAQKSVGLVPTLLRGVPEGALRHLAEVNCCLLLVFPNPMQAFNV